MISSAQTILRTEIPAVILPNSDIRMDLDLYSRDLFFLLDRNEWQTGTIIEFGKYALFETLRTAEDFGLRTEDPDLAIAYLNQLLRSSDRRLPGWRFALKPSALIMEFDQARADRDLEEIAGEE